MEYANAEMTTYKAVFANDGFIIPEENKAQIFDSFYRIKETCNYPGTGIGLTLSRSLAEMHGGTLILDTSKKNRNVFILILPVHPITHDQI
jgi:signal transduction histidine kinase